MVFTDPSTRLLTLKAAGRPQLRNKAQWVIPSLGFRPSLHHNIMNPLLCRLLTSAQSPHVLLHTALLSFDRRKVGQISPGKNMIFPYTTAAFTISQRSGWASSCCADSPWGSALLCNFCPSAHRFALRLLSDGRSPFRPCLRLVLFKVAKYDNFPDNVQGT